MAITQDVIVNVNKAIANIKKFNEQIKKTAKGATEAAGKLGKFKGVAIGAFAAITAYRIGDHLFQQFKQAIAGGIEFSKTLGEIETLMPEVERNTKTTGVLFGLNII